MRCMVAVAHQDSRQLAAQRTSASGCPLVSTWLVEPPAHGPWGALHRFLLLLLLLLLLRQRRWRRRQRWQQQLKVLVTSSTFFGGARTHSAAAVSPASSGPTSHRRCSPAVRVAADDLPACEQALSLLVRWMAPPLSLAAVVMTALH